MEERHKCKLCSRSFINGRALGGHMKAHLPNFSIQHHNPNKTFRSPDPQILPDSQTETETETTESSKNPTRRRSKRSRRFKTDPTPSPPSPEPASSISDTSPEEDIANCLVMLSMESPSMWELPGKSTAAVGKSFRCGKCRKSFRSNRALFGHRKVCRNEEEGKWKIFKCPYCCKMFGSGQALGGHKRSHLQRTAIDGSSTKLEIGLDLDLNFPPPMEEDDHYSVVSDA